MKQFYNIMLIIYSQNHPFDKAMNKWFNQTNLYFLVPTTQSIETIKIEIFPAKVSQIGEQQDIFLH